MKRSRLLRRLTDLVLAYRVIENDIEKYDAGLRSATDLPIEVIDALTIIERTRFERLGKENEGRRMTLSEYRERPRFVHRKARNRKCL